MNNGKTGLKAFLYVICTIIGACACFFAMEGTGTYKYEAMIGDSLGVETSVIVVDLEIRELEDYEGPYACETLDDEFDLLEDGELSVWVWFQRLQLWVRMDQNGELHYGTS